MSGERIIQIADRSIAELQAGASDNDVLYRCIIAMAKEVAGSLYLAVHGKVATTPFGHLIALSRDLDAHAAMVGCDLALRVRRAVYPDLAEDAAMTEAEQLAIQTYWAELKRLDDTFSETRGSA